MRQSGTRRRAKCRKVRGWLLLTAGNEAGDVVGLARCADKFVDTIHQEMQRFLGAPIRESADGAQPAVLPKFLAILIKRFDYAVCIKDQRIAGSEVDRSGFI